MTLAFHPEADAELTEAVAYYEKCDTGLGLDFFREVYFAVQNAVDYPLMWPKIETDVRRCLVHRFPYGVLYSVEPNGIFILAVMNLHRAPDYWKHRLGNSANG